MGLNDDIIGSLATPEERRAGVQRAYDDGYEDGRLDIERELEKRITAAIVDIVSLKDQVDYWRNEFTRVNTILALQIEQTDEAVNEAFNEGYDAGQNYILDSHGE